MDTDAALAVRLVLAIGLAWLLTFAFGRRLLRLDLRGAGIAGGVCAGIALGPMGLEKVAPGFYQEIAVGGIEARAEIAKLDRQWELDRMALEESGVTGIAIKAASDSYHLWRSHLESRLQSELEFFRDLPLAIASSLGLVALFLGVMRERGAAFASMRLGVGVTLMVGLTWAVLARRVIGAELATAAAMGGVLAAGTVWTRGSWRTGFGLGCAGTAVLLVATGEAFDAAWRAMVALGAGVLIGRLVEFGSKGQRRSAWIAHGLLIPAVAALMVSSCDLSGAPTGALAFVLVAGVLGADLHFGATYIAFGWMGRGWRRVRPMTAWHGAYAQGWGGTQIVLANLVLAFGLMQSKPEIAGVLGLSAGVMALAGEITRPATHKALSLMRQAGATTHL